MTFQDTWAICTKCGEKFVFRIEDQRRQAKQGEPITPPEFCPNCASAQGKSSKPEPAAKLQPGPHEGQVKWYSPDKGYGFIVHTNGEDIFFHRTGIASGETPSFPDGTPVTYLIEYGEKGPEAVGVARLDTE